MALKKQENGRQPTKSYETIQQHRHLFRILKILEIAVTAEDTLPHSTPIRKLIGVLLVDFFRHIVLSL
jgi:hypothetical protein